MASTIEHSGSGVMPVRADVVCGQGLRVECLTVDQLDRSMLSTWETICESQPGLNRGYFRPEYFRAASAVLRNVEVAVLQNRNVITGFWPFQRGRFGTARPVGGILNDFHGVIARGSLTELDMCQVLDACGLKYAAFAALVDQGLLRNKISFAHRASPSINLKAGVDAYRDWLNENHLSIRRQPQKSRKMVRELGPLNLEVDSRDESVLAQVIAWKRARFRQTRVNDLFRDREMQRLLHELFAVRTKGFRGLASGLWAGKKLVAAHFGFISGDTLHYWFPSYDPACGKYSPGTALLLEIIRRCPALGVRHIDLTFGQSPLKDRFANDQCFVEACCFTRNTLRGWAGLQQFRIRQAMRRLPGKEPLKCLFRPRWLAARS